MRQGDIVVETETKRSGRIESTDFDAMYGLQIVVRWLDNGKTSTSMSADLFDIKEEFNP